MSRSSVSILRVTGIAVLAAISPCAAASNESPVVMHPESDFVSPHAVSTVDHQHQHQRVKFSVEQLAGLRVQGADITLIQSNNVGPTYTLISTEPTDPIANDAIQQLYESTNAIRSNNDNVVFSVDRNTTLNDGNIAGNSGSLPGSENSISTMTQREGEYNFYEMQMEWKAASRGPVDFSLTSGVTAIEANVSKQINSSGGATDLVDATHKVIAVPTIGSSVRWNISRDLSLTGTATTQSLNMGSSLLGFNAQTDWRISDRIDLSAGYQILRSEFDLGAVTTDLNQEGLFARLSIKF